MINEEVALGDTPGATGPSVSGKKIDLVFKMRDGGPIYIYIYIYI